MSQAPGALAGKVVAITGAGGGLGRAYALAAAGEGARLVVADVAAGAAAAVVAEIAAAGGDALALAVDIAAPGAGERIAAAALDAFGRLDGFVANAALLSPGPLLAQPEDTIRRTLDVNVGGTLGTVRAAARTMGPGGSIVVIVSGSLLGAEDLALYGTTKAAALGLVYGLSLELARSGIRINGLAPRARTGMSAQMGDAGEDKGGPPEGVAPVVVHLLGDASRTLNGHVLRFDGERLGLFRPPRIAREVSAVRWDAGTVAAALSGPLAAEIDAATPGAARRHGADGPDVLDIETAHSSKRLGAEGDE
ncbi:MAG: SDR family oxidoreductase [Actinobacteria bacterium]|nr:SDR family oxidoreductase [Actinomycetota bacterium]